MSEKRNEFKRDPETHQLVLCKENQLALHHDGIDVDYLIELEGSEFTRPIVENPLFLGSYSQEVIVDGPGDRSLTIYRRRSGPVGQY